MNSAFKRAWKTLIAEFGYSPGWQVGIKPVPILPGGVTQGFLRFGPQDLRKMLPAYVYIRREGALMGSAVASASSSLTA